MYQSMRAGATAVRRAPLNINWMRRGNRGVGASSRNRKDQNSCRKQA